MSSAFERLINKIPANLSVLDIGAGGCDGENTSDYLLRRFNNYAGVNIKHSSDIDRWYANHPDVPMIFADFRDLDRKWDVLVADLTIELELSLWQDSAPLKERVNLGGYVIMYVMTDPNYGDSDTHIKLAEFREWLGGFERENIVKKLSNLDGFTFIALEQEERRPEIYWALLKYE